MDGSDWLNAQLSNNMLGTNLKGGHSASNDNDTCLKIYYCTVTQASFFFAPSSATLLVPEVASLHLLLSLHMRGRWPCQVTCSG